MKQLKLAAGLVLATGHSACATAGPDYQPPHVKDLVGGKAGGPCRGIRVMGL